MMRCFYAGSFDPPTLGHIDLIRRASRLFDEVVAGVMINPDKKGMFPVPERANSCAAASLSIYRRSICCF